MAIRPVYSAKIEFKFATDELDASLAKVESAIQAAVKNISGVTSGIKLDVPDIGAAVGKFGGLSDIGVKLAREVRSMVRDAFKDIEGDIDIESVSRALDEVADKIGSTSKSIVARLARMNDETGEAFKEFREAPIEEAEELYRALVGRSIIPDLVDRVIEEFQEMSKKSSDIFRSMISRIISSTEDIKGVDISTDLASKMGEEGPTIDLGPISDALKKSALAARDARDDIYKAMVDIDKTAKATILPTVEIFDKLSNALQYTLRLAVKLASSDWDSFEGAVSSLGKVMGKAGENISETANVILAATPAAKEFVSTVGSSAANQIKKTTQSLGNFKRGFQDAFDIKVTPSDALEMPKFRGAIAEMEQTLSRLPDKTSAGFNELKRSFGEIRTEAIRVQKQFEKGISKEEDLISTKERLDAIGESISEFKLGELEKLREELKRNANTVSLTGRTFRERMTDIRDGISLASEGGASKLLSLRVALSGIGETTGPVSRLLDKFTSNLDDVGKAEGRLAEITSKATKSLASQNNAIKSSIDAIKRVAKIEGLHASALTEVDSQVNRVQKAYKDMTTTIEATGKATPQQVSRVREEYRLLQESISLVKKENEDAIGPETLAALGDLEKKISRNVPVTRILADTLDAAAEKVDKLKTSAGNLGDETKKSTSLFGRFKQSIAGLFGFTSKQADEMDKLKTATASAASAASSAGAVFLGAFGGALLGSIVGIKSALIGLADSVGSQVERNTARIQTAFDLLPAEAEAVSASISDIYESNLGGSIDEIGEAVQRSIARFRELGVTSQKEISGVTKDAFRLSKIYRFDVSESLDATAVLMRQFNLTTKESTNFLAGLGKAGIIGSDALDSILEYATQIKSAGGNADTLFNIIKTGFAGGGTLGTDKAVDLFKEFRLQIASGSDDVKKALNEIGINSNRLMAQLSDGTISVTQAFEFVSEKLTLIDDDTAQTRLGAELMGTQFEDMGNQMALAISTVGTTMNDLVGASDSLAITYTDLGSGIEAVNRRMEVTFGPIKDAFLSLAMQAIPPIMAGLDSLRPIIERIAVRVQALVAALTSQDWGTAQDIIIGAMTNIAEGASSVLEWLIASGFDWGANFVIEIANGLIETANQVIVDAMNYIGDMIGSFMAPGSPPEKGPLSTIDKWGKGLMKTFGLGFKSADFKFVEQAIRPIEEHFKKAFGAEGFEAFEGIKNKFTEIVAELNTTGLVDADKFKEIETAIGGANTELTKMLKVQLKLKKSQKDLADAQREVTDAEAAGFVSEGLKRKLKTAEEEVKVAKENVSWQQEFLKFQGKSEEGFTGLAAGAAKMGSAAAGGAARASKAIRSMVDRQLQFIQTGFKKEKALLEEKFKVGLIEEDNYLKSLIKLEEKYVDTSLEKGLLSGEELSKWADRINQLKSSLEDIKKTSKSITPIGAAIFGETKEEGDFKGGVGKNLLTGAKDMGISIGDNLAEGLLESSKTKLKAVLGQIGASISTIIREKILAQLTPEQKQVGGIIGSALLGIGVSGLIAKIGLVASKVGALSGIALRFSLVGAGIWLIWKNWDTILTGVNTAVAYLSELWVDFTDKLGGSEETFAIFSGIFEDVKTTLTEIGSGLKNFVLDALAGESISFADFIDIFDISGIDTGPITKVVDAFMSVLQEQVDKIKLSITLGGEDEPTRIGGEIADADPSRFEKIVANFTRIFDNLKQSIADIEASFEDFMGEDRLGGKMAGLIDAITESWAALSVVIGGPLLLYLPTVLTFLGRFVPLIGPIASTLGKIIPTVAIATVVIGNFGKIWPPIETALSGAVLVITGLVDAIGGIFLLFDDETRAEGVEMFFSGLVDVITGVQEALIGLGTSVAVFIVSAVGDISGGIASILESFGLVSDPFRDLELAMDNASQWINDMADEATKILRGLRVQIKVILFLMAKNFANWVEGIWKSVTGWFTKIWDDLVGNSIVTDIVDGIVAAFATLKTTITAPLISMYVRIKTIFTLISDYIGTKIESIKTFASDIKDFILEVVKTVGELKFSTIDDIATSIEAVLALFANFNLIDISVGIQSVIDSLTTLASDGLSAVEGFITGIVESVTGIDISESVEAIFSPIHTALTAISDFDLTNLGTLIGDQVTAMQTSLSGMFGDDVGIGTAIGVFETAVTDGLGGLVLNAGLKILNLSTFIVDTFTGIDVSEAIESLSTTVTEGIAGMVTSAGDSISGWATDMIDKILSIPTTIKEKISEFTDVGSLISSAFGFGGEDITGDIASEMASGEAGIVAPVESTTEKIKGAWTDAYDWVVGGSVVPDMVVGVQEQFAIMGTTIPLVTSTMTNSVSLSFSTMSLSVIGSVTGMALAIQSGLAIINAIMVQDYSSVSGLVMTSLSAMSGMVSGILATVRASWVSTFSAMTSTVTQFGITGRKVLKVVDDLVRALIKRVEKLKSSLDRAKEALDALREMDLDDLQDAFKSLYSQMKKIRKQAKDFKKFMEAARDAAKDIGDTLGGNVPAPGAQHGAWDVPRDQLMFIHKKETVLPAEVAADFRSLMTTLQSAGIGTESFNIQTGTPEAAVAGKQAGGPTIITNQIQANFPNVTSAQEADGIAEKLNELIDNSRKFAAVGGPA